MPDRIAHLAAAVRSGSTSAGVIVADAIDRAERSQPAINAFTTIDREGALQRAASIDKRAGSGIDPGPLAGVPIGLKDLIDQKGIPTTNGAAFEAAVPERSAPVVSRLEDAGAVIIGRTGLHEFAYGFTSENEHFGPVRNPWDVALSPGGSSGGSGAAVAAGVVSAAIGTDTGGSVRVPAALCGVTGLKVTYGRVPLEGVTPLAPSLDTVGPLAGSVADLAVLYRVMAGEDRSIDAADLSGVRIGVPRQWTGGVIDAATRGAFEGVLERIAGAAAAVEPVDEPALAVTDIAAAAVSVEIMKVHRKRWMNEPGRYGAEVAERLGAAAAVPESYARDVLEWDAAARRALERLFDRFDVLATPTVGAMRKVIGVPDMDVDGEPVFHRTVLAQYTWPVNRTGNPALALPVPGSGAPPASLQLIGPRFEEAALLGVGLALEEQGFIATELPPMYFA